MFGARTRLLRCLLAVEITLSGASMQRWRARAASPGVVVACGVGAGIGTSLLAWEPALSLWPLLLAAALVPRLRRLGVGVLSGVLTIIAVAQVNAAAAAIPIAGELQYGEAIIYSHAARLLRGEHLYQPIDQPPYTIASYTPIYYGLGAALRVLFGDGFGPGRALSLGSGVTAAILVGALAARTAGDRWAGVFAGLLFLALGMPWVQPRVDLFVAGDVLGTAWTSLVADMEVGTPWLGLYKEDVLGVALSLGAIAVLHRHGSRGATAAAAVLAALAFLTKQTLVAPGLAGALWLWTQDRRRAVLFAGIAAGVVGTAALGLEATSGAFFANTVVGNVNPMGLDALASTGAVLLRFQGGPILAAAMGAVVLLRSGEGRDRLLVLYWLASLVPLVGLAKVGSNHNHWMELAASTAILAGVGVWRLSAATERSRWTSVAPVAALAIALLAVMPLLSGGARMRPSWPGPDAAEVEERRSLVQRVGAEPREVLAAPLDLLALSDRPILLEPYIYAILERLGRWDATPLVRRICAGEVGLLVFENALEDGSGLYHGYPFWPDSVLAALLETMVLDRTESRYYLYVPRPGPGDPGPACRG